MAKGYASAVSDAALNYIKNNCTRIAAVLAYAPGMSFAAATAPANVVAKIDMLSSDFVLLTDGQGNRAVRSTSKVDSNTGAGDPTHYLLLDLTNSVILAWAEETGTVTGTAGGALRIPELTLTLEQPV